MASDVLVFEHVDASYGDIRVLWDVSLCLREGRLLALLGRNGAGKSTCMRVAVGLLQPRTGVVRLFGRPINGRLPEVLVAEGIALVPQGRRLFRSLTVRENLLVAERASRTSNSMPWTLESVYVTFPRLLERDKYLASHLSGGEQQMLAIGRALMSNPQVLLMDEPSEGLAPRIVADLMSVIRQLKGQGLSIILVEQNPKLALDIADDVVVLNSGRVVVHAPTSDLGMSVEDFRKHLGVF